MTKPIEQKIRARLEFNEKALKAEGHKIIGKQDKFDQSGDDIELGSEVGWSYSPSDLKLFRKGAIWQHTKLVNELAPLLAELGTASQSVLKTTPWESEHQAVAIKKLSEALENLEAWLGNKG